MEDIEDVETMAKPRLLFLSQNLPFPPDGGAKIRTYNTLRELARGFDITALCFTRWKKKHEVRDVDRAVRGLSDFGRITAFDIPQGSSRSRFVLDHLRSLATRRVYTRYVYDSSRFRAALARAVSEDDFDLVHADSLDLARYFPGISDHPLVCVHHDVQSKLLERRAAYDSSPLRRQYTKLQARAMRREEAHWCPRVALNVAVSPHDASTLREIAPRGRYTVFPNGVDVEYFQPGSESGGDGIVFVGGTSWFPNLDALHFFGGDILPLMRRRFPALPVRWVGRATDAEIRESQERYGIAMTGYVDDVRPYLRNADVVVVPIRVGGGTRIKILDAWAMGKAVVSTSIGCEGLDARHGENLLVADDPAEFEEAVRELLENRSLRERLAEGARSTAVETYGWRKIGEAMRSRYRELLTA